MTRGITKRKPGTLTELQSRFVAEYMVDMNAKAATIRAGYSPATAHVQATNLLRVPAVRDAIDRWHASVMGRYDVTVDRVVAEVAKLAFTSMDDFVRSDGVDRELDLSTATREQMAAVSEYTVEEYVEGRGDGAREVKRRKIKLHSKLAALDILAKRLKLYDQPPAGNTFVDARQVNVTINAADPIEAAQQYKKFLEPAP